MAQLTSTLHSTELASDFSMNAAAIGTAPNVFFVR
jgi:hypothetical protein